MEIEKKTILVAEDDTVIRELLTVMLKTAGFDLLTASDGVEAVETFKAHSDQVRLIITDIGMPRMNGLEAIVIIRQMSTSVPIMILSIWEEKEYQKIAQENNVQNYMKKPFDVEELIRKVREAVKNPPKPAPSASA